MPLFLVPVILGGATLVTSTFGLAKGKSGVDKGLEARRIVEAAKESQQKKLEEFEQARKFIARRWDDFNLMKAEIKLSTFTDYIAYLEKIQRAGRRKKVEATTIPNFSAGPPLNISAQLADAKAFAQGGLGALGLGVAAGQGAASLVGTYGVASTGAAIGGLSGAAANSAFLAWLGGGSLAAGGGGMALGTVILGGICVAPAALIGGFTFANQGQKALTRARALEAEVNVTNEKIGGQIAFVRRVGRRITELEEILTRLAQRADRIMETLDPELVVDKDEEACRKFTVLVGLMRALSEALKVPLLDEEDNLNRETADVIKRGREACGEDA